MVRWNETSPEDMQIRIRAWSRTVNLQSLRGQQDGSVSEGACHWDWVQSSITQQWGTNSYKSTLTSTQNLDTMTCVHPHIFIYAPPFSKIIKLLLWSIKESNIFLSQESDLDLEWICWIWICSCWSWQSILSEIQPLLNGWHRPQPETSACSWNATFLLCRCQG